MSVVDSFSEDFWRCPKCGNASFYVKEKVILEKDLQNKDLSFNEKYPLALNRVKEYECSECKKTITREELIENE